MLFKCQLDLWIYKVLLKFLEARKSKIEVPADLASGSPIVQSTMYRSLSGTSRPLKPEQEVGTNPFSRYFNKSGGIFNFQQIEIIPG